MSRSVGILFALVLAVSLVLVPATALAQDEYSGLHNCAWDKVKWGEGSDYVIRDSVYLYLQHWGRTPIQAMTRLSGLCGPDILCAQLGTNCPNPATSALYGDPNACLHGCPSCRDVEQGCLACCDDIAVCQESLCEFGCLIPAIGPKECVACNPTRVIETELPHCCCCWGVSLSMSNKSWAGCTISTNPRVNDQHPNHFGLSECYGGGKGGDWGISGCPHTECCSLTWCLQDNLCANPLSNL